RGKDLGRFGVGESGLQRGLVRLHYFWSSLAEPGLDPLLSRLERPIVQPVHQTQRPEILAAVDLLWRKLDLISKSRTVQGSNRQFEDAVARQTVILEWIPRVSGLLQVVFVEGVLVYDQDSARLQIGQVHLKGCRVHGYKHVRCVAGCADIVTGKVQLKS